MLANFIIEIVASVMLQVSVSVFENCRHNKNDSCFHLLLTRHSFLKGMHLLQKEQDLLYPGLETVDL